MTRDGHVRVDRLGRIDLTRKGRQFAERLALRHQLAEMLLTDVIGLPWSKAHDEAERMEHAISPEVEALLLKRFADKQSCPHGVPMRGGIAKLRKQGAVLLSDLRANDKAEILCVYEKDAQFLAFLENLELRPETQVEVKKREYDETMTLRAGGPNDAPRQARHHQNLGPQNWRVAVFGARKLAPAFTVSDRETDILSRNRLHYSQLGTSVGALSKANLPQTGRLFKESAMKRTKFSTEQRAHWRWLVYVILALTGGLLTFVGARAQQRASDDATFRKLIDGYCAAWSSGNADAPAKFYAKDKQPRLLRYSSILLSRLEGISRRRRKRAFRQHGQRQSDRRQRPESYAARHARVDHRPYAFLGKTKDGKAIEVEIRYTGIWEKRGANWLLVHEHLSAPLGG